MHAHGDGERVGEKLYYVATPWLRDRLQKSGVDEDGQHQAVRFQLQFPRGDQRDQEYQGVSPHKSMRHVRRSYRNGRYVRSPEILEAVCQMRGFDSMV